MADLHEGGNIKGKVCSKCRMKFYKIRKQDSADNKASSDSERSLKAIMSDESEDPSASNVAVDLLNSSLQVVGASPIKKKRLMEKNCPTKKLKTVMDVVQTKMLNYELSGDEDVAPESHDSEIIAQLKEKFKNTTKKSEQLQILTILPKSWSVRKIENKFGVSNYMARKTKELVKTKGILSTPNPKPGKMLSNDTVKLIHSFYNDDEISRCMPGIKDFITVKEQGKKVQKQKRLLLCNLNEAYNLFKECHPTEKVGISKFCELRPRNVITAGASGTHSICVCSIHQNVKLMLIGSRIKDLTAGFHYELNSYKHCLSQLICNPSLPECHLGSCKYCPGEGNLKAILTDAFETNAVDEVTYKQWVTTDRSTLQTITTSIEEFLDLLFQKLKKLLHHSFIALQQSSFQNELKLILNPNEYIVMCDFAENYSFLLQDEIQAYHWTNAQATLHPFVIYFRSTDDILNHVSYVVISDCLSHDTAAVHLFQKHLIAYVTKKFQMKPKQIYYFSDGCAAQYKNKKNFINLCCHEKDFGVYAEWHFYAMSHGKGPCDGLAGRVKCLVARASLQRPYSDQIMTPLQLYTWCIENIKACDFEYCNTSQYNEETKLLQERFSKSCTISGTTGLHAFIPINTTRLKTKIYSHADNFQEANIVLNDELDYDSISGFVACSDKGNWWIGCVLHKEKETDQVKLMFLHSSDHHHLTLFLQNLISGIFLGSLF